MPEISTFSVDDGFSYLLEATSDVVVGSRVRIKVSGRRTKGFVTALFDDETVRKLLPIEGLSGSLPSFDEAMLESLRWAATHYVSPLSVVLKRTVPPNIPKLARGEMARGEIDGAGERGSPPRAKPTLYRVGAPPYGPAVAETIKESVAELRNVVVIAPSALEVAGVASHLEERYAERVVMATSSMSPREVTDSWTRIATGIGTILVGTREVMLWPYGDIALAVVVEDGRRVMRSPRTPTMSVRDIILRRSKSEAFNVVFIGPVPTLEVIARRPAVEYPPGRQWPMVEVADRGEDPPGGGVLTEKAGRAIRLSAKGGERVFVLVSSRGYAPAFACVRCGDVRRCSPCGSAASREDVCRRCGEIFGPCPRCGGARFRPLGAGIDRVVEDIKRLVGNKVGRAEDNRVVTVGSERDLIGVSDVGLAVAIDVDGITMAPHYRAREDALRLLVRLAQTIRRGGGHRCLIQTALPGQDVVVALLEGLSAPFLEAEMVARKRFGFPPVGELIAIEADAASAVGDLLLEVVGSSETLLGPAQVGDRKRWLLQGPNLDAARIALRPVIGTLRARGGRVRVDVDPIDL